MSATVQHPSLNDSYLFRTKAEAEAFFNALRVADATTIAAGVVLKAAAVVTVSFSSYTNSDYVTIEQQGATYDVPSKTAHDETRTRLLTLSNAFEDLRSKLISAGIISAS